MALCIIVDRSTIDFTTTQPVRVAQLVFKSGPDCGMAKLNFDGVDLPTWDTFGDGVVWQSTYVIARNLQANVSHQLVVQVLGGSSLASSDRWVQLVGLALWQ